MKGSCPQTTYREQKVWRFSNHWSNLTCLKTLVGSASVLLGLWCFPAASLHGLLTTLLISTLTWLHHLVVWALHLLPAPPKTIPGKLWCLFYQNLGVPLNFIPGFYTWKSTFPGIWSQAENTHPNGFLEKHSGLQ